MIDYPDTKNNQTFDTYFGKKILDSYRWLEDDNSTETKAWVSSQNKITFGYLETLPRRNEIKTRLLSIFNYERFGSFQKINDKYYFWYNSGLQNQNVLYVRDSLQGESREVLDPNSFSDDGSSSVDQIAFSKSGRYLAYSVGEGGSDWKRIEILDVESGQRLTDTLEWVKFSKISWFQNGFFYSRYPKPKSADSLTQKNQNHALYYHVLGTNQSADILIFQDIENADRNVEAVTSYDETVMVLFRSESTYGSMTAVAKLPHSISDLGSLSFEYVHNSFSEEFEFLGNIGSRLYFLTSLNAKNSQIVCYHVDTIRSQKYNSVVPESIHKLRDASLTKNTIICSYTKDVQSELVVFDSMGKKIQTIALPEIGSVSGLQACPDDDEVFYTFHTFTSPGNVFRLVTSSLTSTKPAVPERIASSVLDFESEMYETKQVFYDSKDGTKIPMFIVHKIGVVLDGSNPLLLYGYGGFNISVMPSFAPSKALFMEMGGVFCVANIRGGGEYGEAWHEGGTKFNKQNVFDDFIAAAEYLVDHKYTSPDRLVIEGGSNGGLLVAACMVQRPDLFAVCLPRVGVLDMLRYHTFTIGWAWAKDYGTSDESKEMFEYILAYSPLHNCKSGDYPATLITTADHDDRVVPAHSFKFAATLQSAQQSQNPILIRVDTKAGHGAGKSITMTIEENADILSFIWANVKYSDKA